VYRKAIYAALQMVVLDLEDAHVRNSESNNGNGNGNGDGDGEYEKHVAGVTPLHLHGVADVMRATRIALNCHLSK
jgi:hypothetical protein